MCFQFSSRILTAAFFFGLAWLWLWLMAMALTMAKEREASASAALGRSADRQAGPATHLRPREVRGRSDCVENALEVTLTTDSMSESPNSPIKSLSGESECLGRMRESIDCKSLSDSPV